MFLAQTFGNNSSIEVKKMTRLWCIMNYFLFWNVSASELSHSVLYVFTAQSAWFISVSLRSLTSIYWLIAYFYLFTTFKRHTVVVSVVSGWRSGLSQFILVIFSPRSWAASVRPSTLPRRLWRRNMPDVSFTKTNRNHGFKLWSFSSPQRRYL